MLFRLVGPLVGVVLATILSGATGVSPLQHPGPVLWAAAVIATTVAGVAFLPWRRLPVFVSVVPPVAFVAASLLIRQAAGGDAGYDLLILLPVVWTAVYAQVLELLAVLASVGVARVVLQISTTAPPDGSARSMFVVATAAFLGLVVHQVVGQLRNQTTELKTAARSDYLTGVLNRLGWDEELRKALREAAATGEPLSIVVLDLDHFKAFNDRAGHLEGDRLLREITRAWLVELRRSDLLARMGGDEFAAVLRGCGADAAAVVASRLCECVPGAETTCSAGVALWDGAEPAEALVTRADEALYRAKAAGRARVEISPVTLPA